MNKLVDKTLAVIVGLAIAITLCIAATAITQKVKEAYYFSTPTVISPEVLDSIELKIPLEYRESWRAYAIAILQSGYRPALGNTSFEVAKWADEMLAEENRRFKKEEEK